MEILKAINIALRFLLELCALAALGYWGFQTGRGPILKVVLGLAAPLLAALLWATFVAPEARVTLPAAARLLLGLVVLGTSAVALAAAGHPTLAWVFGLVIVINQALIYVWKQ